MSIDVPADHFYLGSTVEDDEAVFYEASNLTTHGVIVGMTGSGKTGLGVIMLEEALLSGVPTLIIDPKGDMGNLLLSFPNLLPTDFAPWISESEADGDVAAAALKKAELWRSGLERSGITPDRIQRLHDVADFTIYTPGSTSGVPLNIIGSMAAPPAGTDDETLQDEIEGLVSSLLGLVGINSDPLSGREHILLSNLLNNAWSQGQDMDLGLLIGQVQSPPMRKLGVIDLDTFFPPGDRVKLAMKLNGLAASPAFTSWTQGPDLDMSRLLYGTSGKPQAAIVSIAHLNDEERQFVVTLLLSKMVTWMRAQPGTSDLRALIYMDEVFGYVPPTAMPPSKKPILTILKQARAFGVGLVLSTQNPVDIDYKAISNAGTWMIGRLQTERDRDRLLDGMSSSDGSVDTAAIGQTISSLDKRQFVLHSTKLRAPKVFGTRWAMSYLPGPLTREQIDKLTPAEAREHVPSTSGGSPAGAVAASAPAAAASSLRDDESTIAPQVADNVRVAYLDRGAPFMRDIGGSATGKRLVAGLAVRVEMLFDEAKADLRHEAEWEAIITPLDGPADADNAVAVDYDDRDLIATAPDDAVYVLPDAKIKNKTYFTAAQTAIKNHLYRNNELELFVNPELKVYSRIDEDRDAFARRCASVADDLADEDAAKLRKVLETKIDRIRDQIAKAEDKVRELEFDAASRKRDQRTGQVLDIAGGVLGSLLGGRRSTRSVTAGLRRSASKGRMAEKAAERLRTAENRYEELMGDQVELEDALQDDLMQIQLEWSEKAETIESMTVGLEKTDISIDEVKLVWIPTE